MTPRLRTLIIDDEPIALEKLRNYVAKTPSLELVAACESPLEATAAIASDDIDLIFTDINMPDLNGLEFVGSLQSPPMVVFITAYDNYAVESYRLSAVDYILKPYSLADFQRAANKALSLYRLKMRESGLPASETAAAEAVPSPGTLFIKVDYRYINVRLADIRFIKGYGEYLQIFTLRRDSPLLTLSSFASIADRLPAHFLQVHRSYIVNMEQVERIERNRIVMDADTLIPVGDSYREAFAAYLSSHSVGRK